MLAAGQMRDRITLLEKSVLRDAFGGEVITWVDRTTVFAKAQPLRGREFFAAQQVQSEISVRFVLRYDSAPAGLNSAWRVNWRNQQYDIVEIIDVDARKTDMELMCRTAQN
jgi:SPP1 family predicted phage head-tail adaptor